MPEEFSRNNLIAAHLPQVSGGTVPPVVVLAAPGRQTVWWVMTVVLAVIATALVARLDERFIANSAVAQSVTGATPMAGARGIYAFTGQLDVKSYGLFMLDVDTGTLWCYEMEKGRDGELRLRLAAARSWIFDRYLEEFNVAAPTPGEVRAMVKQQRSHTASLEGIGGAGPDGNVGGSDRMRTISPIPALAEDSSRIRVETRPASDAPNDN